MADTRRRSGIGSTVSNAGVAASRGNADCTSTARSLGRSPDDAIPGEVRISRTVQSADWGRADDLSMTDALMSPGVPGRVPEVMDKTVS